MSISPPSSKASEPQQQTDKSTISTSTSGGAIGGVESRSSLLGLRGLDYAAQVQRLSPAGGANAPVQMGGGGAPKSDMTWNYHLAGVILESTTGSDNVTMEGYAGSVGEVCHQVYGVPTKGHERKGQTFHEQTRDDHQQHGDAPTTMATEKK